MLPCFTRYVMSRKVACAAGSGPSCSLVLIGCLKFSGMSVVFLVMFVLSAHSSWSVSTVSVMSVENVGMRSLRASPEASAFLDPCSSASEPRMQKLDSSENLTCLILDEGNFVLHSFTQEDIKV